MLKPSDSGRPCPPRHWHYAVLKPSDSARPFLIDQVLVEPAALRILRKNASRHLEPKVMTLLQVLAERPGELWPRDALVERIWGGATASDESLTRLIYLLRRALEAVGGMGDAVRTLSKLGYRLDVEVRPAEPGAEDPQPPASAMPPFSVAVLPVGDRSEHGGGELLADGLTRDLCMLLARVPRFRIAPPSSVALLAAESEDPIAIGRAVQARFIVIGALAKFDRDVLIHIDLIDAAEGILVWSGKSEAIFDRFFELEEEVVCNITTAIATTMNATQPLRVRRTGRFDLSAYERVQVAEAMRARYGRETASNIVDALEEALQREPNDPVTRAALAVQLSQNVVSQWSDDPEAVIDRADRLIAESLSAAPSDPDVLASAGIVAAMFHRPDDAIQHLEMATARNPNDAHARAVLGWQHCLRRADPAGIGLIKDAEAQAPHHPRFGLWATYRATGHLFLLNHADGLIGARQAIDRTPDYYQPYLTCAWAHVGLGALSDARERVEQAVRMESAPILDSFVVEMKKWSVNSPLKDSIRAVLDALADIRVD